MKMTKAKKDTARKLLLKIQFLLWLLCIACAGSPTLSLAQSDRFQKLGIELDPWSEAQISFWKEIYTHYTTLDFVIHDSADLGHLYAVVHSEKEVASEKQKVRNALQAIAAKGKKTGKVEEKSLTEGELLLFKALDRNESPEAYAFASDPARIRMQLGQKELLENAYLVSTHYLTRMEEMLTEEGVPKELSRLPFVESAFNQSAKSSVGATGIWQFMPKTAMRDLRVDSAIDERYDPLKSTRAAAKFLKRNQVQLKNWGLAVMAYHHGAGLVQKAINRLHTHDPVQIIRVFKDPQFLFASRNYLFEFLAMSDVDAQHELFFKKAEKLKLPEFISVSFPTRLPIKTILSHYHVNEVQTRLLNPHFRDPIWRGSASIPAHYPVRLAGITLEEFRKLEYPKVE